MSFIEYREYNPEFINTFLNYQAFITFKSNSTVDEMYLDIRTFLRYIKYINTSNNTEFKIEEFRKIDIKDLTLQDMNKITFNTINDFIYFLKYSLDNSAKSRNRKLASIKKLFAYLDSQNLINSNPTKNINRAKVEKRQPKYLNLNESKELLSKTILSENKYKIRNYAITCIFLNCCIRLNELVSINLSDIKFDERTVKIHGKGNKERILYLNDAVLEAIKNYLEIRPQLNAAYPDYKALFLSNRNQRISRRNVQQIIKNEIITTFNEIKKNIHTHSLRHTGATLMYDINNTDIKVIQEILGHISISSTEIYTHVSDKRLKELMQNFNILDSEARNYE